MNDLKQLTEELKNSRKILLALGDENRMHMVLEMIQMGNCQGVRVNEITKRTHLSRPAVSHHLKILKEAGLVNMHREGTKNYYYFDLDTKAIDQLINMLEHAKQITKSITRNMEE